MVVHNFNFMGIAFMPAEANPPLVVHTNAMLTLTTALQCFEPVARRHDHVPQFRGRVQCQEFASGASLNGRWKPAGQFRPKDPLRLRTRET
jgi:hypothetical protein